MASFKEFFPHVQKWEGSYANDPSDSGGPTKYGVTLATWKAHGRDLNHDGLIDIKDIQLITLQDAMVVAEALYWDVLKADQIHSQEIADIIVDWGWGSGPATAAMQVQELLKVPVDGKFGNYTINAINSKDPAKLFAMIKADRAQFYRDLVVRRPKDKRFFNGWMNRLNDLDAPGDKKKG